MKISAHAKAHALRLLAEREAYVRQYNTDRMRADCLSAEHIEYIHQQNADIFEYYRQQIEQGEIPTRLFEDELQNFMLH